ncbi:MAG: tetratricopeptide repeat protein [Planctomycetota bacterium]
MELTEKEKQARNSAIIENEIFDNKEVAQLIAQARKHDPMYCNPEDANRNKAVSYYEKAMQQQAGSKVNTVLANRIAQLYAFWEDNSKGIRHKPLKARRMWKRSIEWSDPNQLLWSQAQMGLASASVMTGDFESALTAYKKILEVNPDKIQNTDWQITSGGQVQEKDSAIQTEHKKNYIKKMQIRAVENIFYISKRIDPETTITEMHNIAAKYENTPIEDRASKLLLEGLETDLGQILDDSLDNLSIENINESRSERKEVVTEQEKTDFSHRAHSMSPVCNVSDTPRDTEENTTPKSIMILATIITILIIYFCWRSFVSERRRIHD